ncbi:hypothetical protein IW261DRAFT_667742 [Armillaria novae-zelandiae]|uniref:Uncharacterized protein n=1 Tax=Armillaria novae-zelandiae TaxID=153914 RepID=A0AA39NY37_9AGAR|nr:hypothetical protein IW261DRAFT_667742 [Armillaria novae-zelandiae]
MPSNLFSFSMPAGFKITLTTAIYGKLSSKSRGPTDGDLLSTSDGAPKKSGKGTNSQTTVKVHVVEETEQGVHHEPSMFPPETFEEHPEENTVKLTSMGIKVRDFATSSSSTLPLAELFNHHIAIAEYEIRMRENPRVSPIDGKMLYRLVNIGCISREEARKRWHRMDWDSLLHYESLGKPYPYRTVQGLSVPTTRKEREKIIEEWGHYVVFYDQVKAKSYRAERKAVKTREARQLAYLEVEKANRESCSVGLSPLRVPPGSCIGPSLRRKRPTMDGNKPGVVIHCDSADALISTPFTPQSAPLLGQRCSIESLSLQRVDRRQ